MVCEERIYFNFTYCLIFVAFCRPKMFFFKINFFGKNPLKVPLQCQTVWIHIKTDNDLGPNYLQSLSVVHTSNLGSNFAYLYPEGNCSSVPNCLLGPLNAKHVCPKKLTCLGYAKMHGFHGGL